MKKQSDPKSLTLVMVIAIMLCGGGVYWQYTSKVEAEARLAALKSEVPDEQTVRDRLAESQAVLDEHKYKLLHLEANVPQSAYIPTLLWELERMGRENGIKVTGVRPVLTPSSSKKPKDGDKLERVEKKTYQEIDIDITGKGEYRAIMNLLDALQKFPKIVAVRTVGVTPKRDDTQADGQVLEAAVRIRAYVFPPDHKPESKPAQVAEAAAAGDKGAA